MVRANVRPELLTWARERAGLEEAQLERAFPRLSEWERGKAAPTLKQLEKFARAVYVPVGFLFLQEPPLEQLPLPDVRQGTQTRKRPPSPNLLDTLYMCQGRQEWYREHAQISGEPRKAFVGSVTTATDVVVAATAIRNALGFDVQARRACPTWTDALRMFIGQAEKAGILVMCSGVVYNNTHRVLDPGEFRGFAIADALAPLVFLNGADTKAAQMFTLAHELGHLWLGTSGVSDASPATVVRDDAESWCNRVAAELLVPTEMLDRDQLAREALELTMPRLARQFKVSTLVILRRLLDINAISRKRFAAAYEEELERLLSVGSGSGGNFYLSEGARVSKRFAAALIESTVEGQTLYRDAMYMLGIKKLETFAEFGRHLGVAV